MRENQSKCWENAPPTAPRVESCCEIVVGFCPGKSLPHKARCLPEVALAYEDGSDTY